MKNLHHWKENYQKYRKCEYQAEGRIFNPVPQLPHEKMENPISPEQEKKDILQLFSGNFSHWSNLKVMTEIRFLLNFYPMRKTALFYPLLFRNKSSWNTVNCDTCHIFIETTSVDILIYSDSLTQTIQEPHSGVFCIPNYPIQCSKAKKWFPGRFSGGT